MIKLLFYTFILTTSLIADLEFTQQEKQYIQNNPKVTVGSIDSYAPFSFLNGSSKIGFTQDLLSIISKKSGLEFEKIGGTWPEVYGQFETGKIDIISELSYKTSRLPFTIYTKPYYEIPIGVFTNNDFPNYTGIESLKNKKVGVVKNSYLVDVLHTIKDIEVVEIESTDGRFFALKNNEVDAVLSNALSSHRIEQLMLSNIKLAGIFTHHLVNAEDLRFGINKDKPILASIINKTLNSIPYSTLSKLRKKWIVDNQHSQNKIKLNPKEQEYLYNKKYVTMCIDPNWMPFESFDENNNYIGMSADYYKIFEEKLPIEFQLVKTKTWDESLNHAKNRKCDILSLAMSTPSREKYLDFTTPYLSVPLVVATKLNVPFINGMSDLQGKKLGITQGYAFVEILRQQYPNLDIIEVENIDEGLDKVRQDELYAFIGTLATVAYKLQTDLSSELKIAGKLSNHWELGIGVRDDDPILLDVLQKAIDSVSYEQRREILNKWISIKYEQEIDYTLLWQILAIFSILLLFFLYKQYMLKKSVQETSELIDSTLEAILLTQKGICIDLNQSAVDLFGYSNKEEMLKKDIFHFFAQESRLIHDEKKRETDTLPYEANMVRKDNIPFHALIKEKNLSGKNLRIISIIDISKLKQLEAQSKLASMGEMIANIAHQWRQPLSIISTAATGMKMQKTMHVLKDDQFENYCDVINDNAQYLSQTIDDFRNFIKGDHEPIKFSLKNDTDSFIKIVDTTIKNHNIQLILDLDEDIHIQGYPNELIQCFINIFNNAKDAFIQNEISQHERYIFICQKIVNNNLVISFRDNAVGIPKDVLPKVFEPYFTTKHQSQGTGLGLHMAYNIIVNHMDGKIEVENVNYTFDKKSHIGAKFTITLPMP
jgi:PAS domain S-box-containing protein